MHSFNCPMSSIVKEKVTLILISDGQLSDRRCSLGRLLSIVCLVWLIGFTTLFTVSANAVSVRDDVSIDIFNALAVTPKYQAAGFVGSASFNFAFCSGTLVSPSQVLTAAHCVDDNADGFLDIPTSEFVFGVDTNVPGSLSNNVSAITVNPNWVANGGQATDDLSILTLATPLQSVTPANISFANVLDVVGTIVGYGDQGTGASCCAFSLAGANDRLAAQNVIDVFNPSLDIRTDFDSPLVNTSLFGNSSPLAFEGTTAAGDSGGPLYVDLPEGAVVVGVLNGGFNLFNNIAEYGDVSIWAPLSNQSNQRFLRSNGINPIPEPSTLLLLGGSLLGLLGYTRRKR